MAKKLEITLTRSVIGRPQDQRATVEALGLKKLNQTVVKEDNSCYSWYDQQSFSPYNCKRSLRITH